MGLNSLPKTVIRQRRGCDLNPGPSAPESSTLTTRLPSHPFVNAAWSESETARCRLQDRTVLSCPASGVNWALPPPPPPRIGRPSARSQTTRFALPPREVKQGIARGRRDDIPSPRRWPFDGGKNRGGSTSVRGRVCSPHISGGRRWLSCRQPACL